MSAADDLRKIADELDRLGVSGHAAAYLILDFEQGAIEASAWHWVRALPRIAKEDRNEREIVVDIELAIEAVCEAN